MSARRRPRRSVKLGGLADLMNRANESGVNFHKANVAMCAATSAFIAAQGELWQAAAVMRQDCEALLACRRRPKAAR